MSSTGLAPPWPRVSAQGPGPRKVPVCVADVGAFAEAMQNSAGSEQKEGDGKDKKDEEEDMSLD